MRGVAHAVPTKTQSPGRIDDTASTAEVARACQSCVDPVAAIWRGSSPISRSRARHIDGHRGGWEIPWYTITDDFDADFGVGEWHGTSAFIREGDSIFRTYFVDSRGDEAMGSTWSYLDITALGRQEECEDSPEGYPQTAPYRWWNLHDEYDKAG